MPASAFTHLSKIEVAVGIPEEWQIATRAKAQRPFFSGLRSPVTSIDNMPVRRIATALPRKRASQISKTITKLQ